MLAEIAEAERIASDGAASLAIYEAAACALLDAAEAANAASRHVAALNLRLRAAGRADLAVVPPIARRWPHSAQTALPELAIPGPRGANATREAFERDLAPPACPAPSSRSALPRTPMNQPPIPPLPVSAAEAAALRDLTEGAITALSSLVARVNGLSERSEMHGALLHAAGTGMMGLVPLWGPLVAVADAAEVKAPPLLRVVE